MNWFFIALLSTICFSTITHIDKYIINHYLSERGIGSLVLFSAFFPIFILPIISIFEKRIWILPFENIVFLILVGILSFIAVFFYFKALVYVDASTVVPFFQLIPIFGFILGFLFLKETIPLKSIIGGLIIITGVITLSFEKKYNGPITFKKKIFLLMIGSSFVYALYETLFKVITIKETFWVSLFWQNIGLLISGIFIYFFVATYRNDFHKLLKSNRFNFFSLNLINEVLNTAAVGLLQYASLLVPLVLVLLVNSLQPVFVFLIGVVLTIFLPKITAEDITSRMLTQKSIAILIVLTGTCVLYF